MMLDKEYNKDMNGYKHEENFECKKWCKDLPTLSFNQDWLVKIIPPFGNTIVRFTVDNKEKTKHCSIYFDGYSKCGWMYDENNEPIPYWEVYDGEDCSRFLLGEENEMMKLIASVIDGK